MDDMWNVCVFITAVPITKVFAGGGGWRVEDMCYERLRAEASVMMMMMMSFICSCRNKKEEPSSIYTLRKVRTIRGCLEGLTLMI